LPFYNIIWPQKRPNPAFYPHFYPKSGMVPENPVSDYYGKGWELGKEIYN
jgi:hypothetical protein